MDMYRTNNYGNCTKYRLLGLELTRSDTLQYDTFDRPVKVTETVEGNKTFVTETGYDAMGRISREVYPSGFTITSQYDRYGFLKSVTDNKGVKVWEAVSANTHGQLTQYKQGGRVTNFGYNKGRPGSISSSFESTNIIDVSCNFNDYGNVSARLDKYSGQMNYFSYDAANRLTGWKRYKAGATDDITTITYDDATGGIKTKNNVPYQMNYGVAGKPKHALGSITGVPQEASTPQNITYTDFNKMLSVTQGSKSHQLLYGVNSQRIKGTFKTSGITKLTRYYMGNYEEEINAAGNVRKLHYINGGNGLAAIMVRNGGMDSLYYTYCDYQGNLLTVTDAAGNIKERYAYDPYGQRVNPANWTQKDTRTSFLFSRGYTLHEHLDDFGLINMNGRMYDPLVAQFLSPDPYVQAPGNWFNYNRYAYCLNNPLLYTDPSGEVFGVDDVIIIGMMIYMGGLQANFMQAAQNNTNPFNPGNWNWKSANTYIGMVSGGISGASMAGYPISGLQTSGAVPNAALQAGINVGLNGIGNISENRNFFDNWYWSASMGLVSGGIAGYDKAKNMGLNPWTGGLESQQRVYWKEYLSGDITLEELYIAIHGNDYFEAGSPQVVIGNNEKSRGAFIPIDGNGKELELLDASRNYSSVGGRITMNPAGMASGKQFLFTSYHELTHAKMFYNGSMHNRYRFLEMNYGKYIKTSLPKSAFYQVGLKTYTERWAYGAQYARWGINGSRINYVGSMWQQMLSLSPAFENIQRFNLLYNSF